MEDFDVSRQGAPQNAWLEYTIARYLQMRGAPDEQVIERYAASVVRKGPPLNLPKLRAVLEALRRLANIDLSTDDMEKALVRDAEGLTHTAESASERGLYRLEVVARAALCALEPTVGSHLALAAAYRRTGNWDFSRRHLQLVATHRPDNNWELLAEAGFLDLAELKINGAIEAFTTALHILEKTEDSSGRIHGKSVCWSGIAVAHELAQRWRKAEQAIATAIDLEPEKGEYHFILGRILEGRGRRGKAAESYSHALSCDNPPLTHVQRTAAVHRLAVLLGKVPGPS